MSSSGESAGDVFDLRRIRRLVDLMRAYDLSELDLRQGETEIRLRRGAPPPPSGAWTSAPMPIPLAPAAPANAASASPSPSPVAADDATLHLIRSPMVGTFYAAASPEAAPFVKVGDHVGRDTTVCIIEAMKVFNEIQAEVSGQIVAVLVNGGEPVEYGQPLFKVDTSK